MSHGILTIAHTDESGPRGSAQTYNESMLMTEAWRLLGEDRIAFKGMFSAEPLNGAAGFPLLFQTGETADGVHPLVDRQHPHNLVMEASVAYSHAHNLQTATYLYAGLAGEPALGPPAFMHRLSSMDNPEAPITHHWMDFIVQTDF